MRHIAKSVMVLAIATSMIGCSGGCGGTPYKKLATAYASVNKFAVFVEGFDKAVKAYVKSEDERCTKAHVADGVIDKLKYGQCMAPALKFSVAWTGEWGGKKTGKGVLPAIQDAQRATRMQLDSAYDYVQKNEKACGDKEGEEAKKCKAKIEQWKGLLKPGLCGLKIIVERAIKIGAYKLTDDSTYKLVMGMAAAICQ